MQQLELTVNNEIHSRTHSPAIPFPCHTMPLPYHAPANHSPAIHSPAIPFLCHPFLCHTIPLPSIPLPTIPLPFIPLPFIPLPSIPLPYHSSAIHSPAIHSSLLWKFACTQRNLWTWRYGGNTLMPATLTSPGLGTSLQAESTDSA